MSVRVGDVVISGGGADVDNRTINNNEDNELQAIAVVDEGSASYTKTWSGTLAEYEALGDVHDPDTLYYILDDSVGGNVYTKDEVDALLLEKQDTLVSGTNIKTINNQSILGSGNINIQGGTATIDNLSITNNTDGEIQTIGTINQNDNTEALKEWKGTLAEYNAIEEKDDSTKYYIMDDQVTGGTAGNRNVGDIFYSMRTEEILSGAVKCNGATYEIAEFTGEESVGSLLLAGKLPYVSLSEYATEISTNGVCGKFGWDGEGSATFKVPTLNDVFLEASNSVNGGFVEAGLPNITGEIHWNKGTENPTSSGVFNLSYTSISDSGHTALTVPNATTTFDFDASRSSTIYGNSTTVQPKSVKYSAYVQLVLGATDEALETCHNVMSDVDSLKTSLGNKITNCITEIPQDIKLELNDGVLTLKAGSKVYIPNGVGVFDVKITQYDIEVFPTGGTGKCLVCINDKLTNGASSNVNNCVSGPGITPINYGMCYDTTTNIIQRWGDGVLTYSKASLPIAIVTVSNSAFSSIDQVFNGFGYIGNATFALPGIKGLVPDGRNQDGSLKNIAIETTNVMVNTGYNSSSVWRTKNDWLFLSGNSLSAILDEDIYTDYYPTVSSSEWAIVYDSYKNKHFTTNYGTPYTQAYYINSNIKVYRDNTTGRITAIRHNLNPTFKALDYNNTEYIGHQIVPSGRSITLPTAAQGARYTAPADGWFYIHCTTQNATQNYISLGRCITISPSFYGDFGAIGITPKGVTYELWYSNVTNIVIEFIYAEGSK